MTQELSRYERMKSAIVECKMVDEVKEIRDQAMALRVYAQQARDRTLEGDVIEIRLRAERRLGEMMKGQEKAKGGGANQHGPFVVEGIRNPTPEPLTLSEAGIDKNLAKRARKLANMTPEKFDETIARAKHYLSTTIEERQEIPTIDRLDDLIFSLTTADLKGKPMEHLLELRKACLKLVSRIDQTNQSEDNVTCLQNIKPFMKSTKPFS